MLATGQAPGEAETERRVNTAFRNVIADIAAHLGHGRQVRQRPLSVPFGFVRAVKGWAGAVAGSGLFELGVVQLWVVAG